MRIFVHDYAGHPFQVGLSRALAKDGHTVTHCYFADDQGPKGDFVTRAEENGRLNFVGVSLAGGYSKTSLVSRRFKDVQYGRLVAAQIAKARPDVVLSGNTPTEAQSEVLQAAHKVGAAFVHWIQDFFSIAATELLRKKSRAIGSLVGSYYRRLERNQLRRSDAIVLVTDDFLPTAAAWSGDTGKIAVIENWGAIDEIKPLPRDNPWAVSHNLADKFVFLYSGTLALKHNPELLLALVRAWSGNPNIVVAAVAQGVGVDRLKAVKQSEHLDNLKILPLQPVQLLSSVLASADVLVAVLENDAGSFSVPSKVQSYLCSNRPILLAAPATNLAAKILLRENAGVVVNPTDLDTFVTAASKIYGDAAARTTMAYNGYAYAARAYGIDAVMGSFLQVFDQALKKKKQGK